MTYYAILSINKCLETDNDHKYTLMLNILSWLWDLDYLVTRISNKQDTNLMLYYHLFKTEIALNNWESK